MAFCSNCGASMSGVYCNNCGMADGSREARAGSTPATAPAPAKKRSVLPLVLFGCLGMILLTAIGTVGAGWYFAQKAKQAGLDPELMQSNPAMAVAKMVTALNPDIELVKLDEATGTITIREKSTGKVTTVNLDDAKNGRIVFQEEGKQSTEIRAQEGQVEVKGPDGVSRFGSGGSGPDWLPAYASMKSDSLFNSSTNDGKQGTFVFRTADSVDTVTAFYEAELPKKGFTVKKNASHRMEGTQMDVLTATGDGRTADLRVMRAGEETMVTIGWR